MSDTLSVVLRGARRELEKRGIDTAALDARLLMQAATGLAHEEIIATPEQVLTLEEHAAFSALMQRRLQREPISKILGRREFYGRDFVVTRHVLDPRADTETLIDLVLRHLDRSRTLSIVDLGCGSGAIAVTLAAEYPLARVLAVDISAEARHVTLANAVTNGVDGRIAVRDGPWFQYVGGRHELVVSNPPYIESDSIATLDRDVCNYDPHLALDGGVDGLQCYRDIASSVRDSLTKDGLVVVEIGMGQAAAVIAIFAQAQFVLLDQGFDLAGRVRVLAFRLLEAI